MSHDETRRSHVGESGSIWLNNRARRCLRGRLADTKKAVRALEATGLLSLIPPYLAKCLASSACVALLLVAGGCGEDTTSSNAERGAQSSRRASAADAADAADRHVSFARDCIADWNNAADGNLREQMNIGAQRGGQGMPYDVLVTEYPGPTVHDAAVGSAVYSDLRDVTVRAGACLVVPALGGQFFARVGDRFIPTSPILTIRFDDYIEGLPEPPNAQSTRTIPTDSRSSAGLVRFTGRGAGSEHQAAPDESSHRCADFTRNELEITDLRLAGPPDCATVIQSFNGFQDPRPEGWDCEVTSGAPDTGQGDCKREFSRMRYDWRFVGNE